MTQAGGPAAINGFLYQIIHHLGWITKVTLSGTLKGQDIENALLVLEPRCGGDAKAETPDNYLVEQYKTRRNRTWPLSDITKDVMRDLRKAVSLPLQEHAIYRFVTDGRAGRLNKLYDLLKNIRSATELSDLNSANLELFNQIAKETRSNISQRDAEEQTIVFHLLSHFEMEFCVDSNQIAVRIERFLRPLCPNLGDERNIREQLIGVLIEKLSKGETHLDSIKINAMFYHANISPDRLKNLVMLPKKMGDLIRNRLYQLFKYQPDRDVRSIPEWPENKPVLLIAGKSGAGKSWQLARLLEKSIDAHQVVNLIQTPKTEINAKDLLSTAASNLWELGLGETSEKSLVAVSNFFRELKPDATFPHITIAIDDVWNVDLARDFIHHQDWMHLNMRLVLTVPNAVAQSLQFADEETVHVHRVSDFSVNELDALLKKSNQNWADLPPDLKKLLRNPILAGLFLKLPYTSIQKALHSEYEIFDAFWQRIDAHGNPGNKGIVIALAERLYRSKTYPLPRVQRPEIGLDSQGTLNQLIAAGWLQSTEYGEVEFAHDRLLNWAVAQSLAFQFKRKQLSIEDLRDFLTGKSCNTSSTYGNRLDYVPMDTLWLLAAEEENLEALEQLVIFFEESRSFGSHGQDLYTYLLPTLGKRAISILTKRLNTILADPNSNNDYRTILIGKAFANLAQQESVDLKHTIRSLLNALYRSRQDVAIAALTAAPDTKCLDRLWELNQQRWKEFQAETANSSYHDYQASHTALHAGVTLDPEWLRNSILREGMDSQQMAELGYLLNKLDHPSAPVIWEETRDVLIAKIPVDEPRSLLLCIARFLDHSKKDFVIKCLSCLEDAASGAALAALAVLDPQAAIDHLTDIQNSELYLARNRWLPILLHTQPEKTYVRILKLAKDDPPEHRSIRMLFSERPDEINVAILQLFLHSLEKDLRSHLNEINKRDPYYFNQPLDFLGRITHPDLLTILEAKANSELEQMIVAIARARLNSNDRNFDALRDNARRVLILMAGHGITTLIKKELESEHYWIRLDGLNWGFICTDDSIVKKLLEIASRPVPRDLNGKPESESYTEYFQATRALAAIGSDAFLIEAIKGSGIVEVPLDLVELRTHRGVMSKHLTNQILQTLRNPKSTEDELLSAIIITWLSHDTDLVPDLHVVLAKANLESQVVRYACTALQALGDHSNEFAQLALNLVLTKTNTSLGLNILLNLGEQGSEPLENWLENCNDIESMSDANSIIRALYDNPATRSLGIKAAISCCERGKFFLDPPYDIAAEMPSVILREQILEKAFAVDPIMSMQTLRAIQGLAKYDVFRAVEAIETGLRHHHQLERELCRLLVRVSPETAALKLIDAAISIQSDSLKHSVGKAFRQINPEIVSPIVIDRMLNATSNRKVIVELSQWLPIPAIENTLNHLVDKDNSYDIRGSALAALAHHRREVNIRALFTAFPSATYQQRWGLLITILNAADPYLLTDRKDSLWLGNIFTDDVPAVFVHHATLTLERRKQQEKSSSF